MTYPSELLPYDAVLGSLGSTAYLLLGNGFSVACDPIFSYARLYDAAVAAGLSTRAQAVFERLGTNNFEGVMRLLDDAHWIATTYGLVRPGASSEMIDDVSIVKTTLVKAVAKNHLAHTGHVSDEKKAAARAFFERYQSIFTTNYDLLAYWVIMSAGDRLIFQDGFREDEEAADAPYVVFSERLGNARGLFYLHGALHLYLASGELRKRCWSRSHVPLTDLIKQGLEENEYPLFVAEGAAEQKLSQIQRAGYLWYCLNKLARIKSPLVVFGHSLGNSDRHIANTIADNLDLSTVYLGVFGGAASASGQAAWHAAETMKARRAALVKRRRRGKALSVDFYDSESAKPWGKSRP